jgi:hypothetical protein
VIERAEGAISAGSTTQFQAQFQALLRHWENRGEQEDSLFGNVRVETLVEIDWPELELGKIKG